jgi:hypothetical protein
MPVLHYKGEPSTASRSNCLKLPCCLVVRATLPADASELLLRLQLNTSLDFYLLPQQLLERVCNEENGQR